MSDIFLSYASEDRERVRRLVEILEGRGWSVWWDREIPVAADWPSVIEREIAKCRAVVAVWSRKSVGSKWVRIEAREGEGKGCLVPVLLDEVDPPLEFSNLQAADLTEWDGSASHPPLRAALSALAGMIDPSGSDVEQEDESDVPDAPAPHASRRPDDRAPRALAKRIALAAVVVLGAAAVVYEEYVGFSEPETEYRRVFYEGFDEAPVGPSDIWLVGGRSGAAWEGSIAEGVHRICNVEDDASASFTNRLGYYDLDDVAVDQADSRASLEVSVHPPFSPNSGAGLLFRSRAERPDYYAFVLNAGGIVSLYRRTPETLSILQSVEIDGLEDGQTVALTAEGSGPDIRLFVNDELVFSFEDEELGAGDPGLFAYSRGCFVFDEVSVFHPVGD